MSENEIHVGDVGTVLKVTINDGSAVVDVSTATGKIIILQDPEGTSKEKTADFTTDGSDGKIQYTSVAGDFDKRGNWSLQAKIIMPSGTWYSDITIFQVYDNL